MNKPPALDPTYPLERWYKPVVKRNARNAMGRRVWSATIVNTRNEAYMHAMGFTSADAAWRAIDAWLLRQHEHDRRYDMSYDLIRKYFTYVTQSGPFNVKFSSLVNASTFRRRAYMYRKQLRNQSKATYPAGHPLYDVTPYDSIMLTIKPSGDGGEYILRFEVQDEGMQAFDDDGNPISFDDVGYTISKEEAIRDIMPDFKINPDEMAKLLEQPVAPYGDQQPTDNISQEDAKAMYDDPDSAF